MHVKAMGSISLTCELLVSIQPIMRVTSPPTRARQKNIRAQKLVRETKSSISLMEKAYISLAKMMACAGAIPPLEN